MDDTGPIDYLVVGTHNDVCVAGIDVLYQGNKAGDGFFQHMGQFLEMGYTVRIGDKDSHDLSGLDADAAHDMAHDAPCGRLLLTPGYGSVPSRHGRRP